MKKYLSSLLIVLALLASPLCVRANDAKDTAQQALDDARNYTVSGDYAKALERYEWFHENALSVNQGYYGVRLSFALDGWKRLGDQYPPALASLKATRDDNVRALERGAGSYQDFCDVFAINQQLGENEATLRLFKTLHGRAPVLAKKCFPVVQDALLAGGETALFIQYAGDLAAYMQKLIEKYQSITGHLRSADRPNAESMLKHFEGELVGTALRLMKLAQQQGDPVAAQKIREMAAGVVDDPRLQAP